MRGPLTLGPEERDRLDDHPATLSPAKVDAELRLRKRVFGDLDALLEDPAVRAGRSCGPVSVPNHKLAPYVRWGLDAG
ncbi:MAG: hypothetical protein M3459_10385, partial [Actinomycetota bacterium]|nr:hypothetical protein [Actinomycetota bacterium]